MKKSLPIILLILFATIIVSCDKAPGYVIGESDMVDLLVDIHQSEALIDMYPEQFGSDSAKMLLKQSVFKAHNVTAEKFDTSMVWYSRNMAVYSDVYDRVIKRLEDSRNDYETKSGKVITATHRRGGGRSYKDFGDTADIWSLGRQLILTANMGKNILPFSYASNQETQLGDKYLLRLKSLSNNGNVNAFVGVEYIDGSVTFIERLASKEGWNEFSIQSDSLKRVKRMFGYIKFDVRKKRYLCYVDSIMLLRVHLDRTSYGNINTQKILDRNKQLQKEKSKNIITEEIDLTEEPVKLQQEPEIKRQMKLQGGEKPKIIEQLSPPQRRRK